MKRFFKYSVRLVIVVLLVGVCAYTFTSTKEQNYSGSYSSACKCSERAREYIICEFGDAESLEDLMSQLNLFACQNFTYVDKRIIFQSFDMDKFIFSDRLHGLCWDFACFTKVAVLEVAQYKGWSNTSVYVCDARCNQSRIGHSFNFISDGQTTYYLDNTFDNTKYKKGKPITGAVNIGSLSTDEFSKTIDYTPYNYH